MAIRLNTLLVVLSVPTLLSAAITILWSRKRRHPALKSPADQIHDSSPDDGIISGKTTGVVSEVTGIVVDDDSRPQVEVVAVAPATTVTESSSCFQRPLPSPLSHPTPDLQSTPSASDPHPHHQSPSERQQQQEECHIGNSDVDVKEKCAPATDQTPAVCAVDPAVCASSPIEGQEQSVITSSAHRDSIDIKMHIGERSEVSATTATGPENNLKKKSSAKSSNGTPASPTATVMNGGKQQSNGKSVPAPQSFAAAAAAAADLSAKVEKDLVLKPRSNSHNKKLAANSESAGKKNSTLNQDNNKAHSPSESKTKNTATSVISRTDGPSSPSETAVVSDNRSRKSHDSGDSVGAASVDSGAEVMSPASNSSSGGVGVDAKSSDRSLDSPCPFKSDVSQGSPCNWGTSDSHSEGSSDSGKGSETQSSSYSPLQQFMPSLNQRTTANVMYQFEMQSDLVGKLIGRSGATIKDIQQRSRSRIVVNDYPFENCDRLAISEALRLIRNTFPVSQFPNLTLAQINAVPVSSTQLFLIDGYPNDVIMSSLVSAGQFFVQQPTHPLYDSLAILNHMMAVTYNEHDAPAISSPAAGIVVAATVPALPGWFRALIVAVSEDGSMCDVKYVDYGGYARLETCNLRQIRMDFMNLPFQACECYLSDVLPAEDVVCSATECFEKLAHGCVLKAIVTGMTDDGCTLVRLYKTNGMTNMCLNEELVNRGMARWIRPPPEPTSSD